MILSITEQSVHEKTSGIITTAEVARACIGTEDSTAAGRNRRAGVQVEEKEPAKPVEK